MLDEIEDPEEHEKDSWIEAVLEIIRPDSQERHASLIGKCDPHNKFSFRALLACRQEFTKDLFRRGTSLWQFLSCHVVFL